MQEPYVIRNGYHELFLVADIRSINTLEKDMPVGKKQPYNPFKIPRAP